MSPQLLYITTHMCTYMHLVEVVVVCFLGLYAVEVVVHVHVGGRGDEVRGVGVVFSRLIRCLSWAERESGGGTGLLLGHWGGERGTVVGVKDE